MPQRRDRRAAPTKVVASRAAACVAAACVVACGAPIGRETAATAPSHLALLVGIDEYSPAAGSRRPDSLAGAKRDVELARSVLVDRFGFPLESIRMRCDSEATHERIVRDWKEWLIDRAGAETEVVFWFSGHGSRCPDAAAGRGGEVGGYDSTLATYDSRVPPTIGVDGKTTARGGYDFTDDELHSLLRALSTRTSRITVVTDSCHSGGVTRGGPRVRFTGDFERSLEREDIADFWPQDVPFLEDGDPARAAPTPWVHVAACAFDQSAVEYVATAADGAKLTNGALTFFLAQELRCAPADDSWRSLTRRVALDISSFHREQQVQAEGELDREIFGTRTRRPPGFGAWVGPASRLIDVDAGALQLLSVGQRLAIVEEGGQPLGEAIVTQVAPATSIAQFEGELPALAQVTAVRALPQVAPDANPLTLHIAPDPRLDTLVAELSKPLAAPSAEPTAEVPPLVVERDRFGSAPLELRARDTGFELLVRPAGPTRARFDTIPTAERVRAVVAEEQRYRELLALGGQTGSFRVEAKLELAAPFAAQVHADGRTGCVRIDDDPSATEQADLVLTLDPTTCDAPLWLTVLQVSEDRTITRLVPTTDGARDSILFPGKPTRLPLSLDATRLDGLARDGIDRLLIFATEDYADFGPFLDRSGTFRSAEETARAVATRGGRSLPGALARALVAAPTRSADASERFGVAVLDVQLLTTGTAATGAAPSR